MTDNISKLPPQNIEAEQSVIGAMLIDGDAVTKVLEILTESAFYRESHKKIFSSIVELYQKNEPADLVTVTNVLKGRGWLEDVGGPSYLTNLVANIPTAANVGYYAKIIYEKSVLRHLISAATDIINGSYSESSQVDSFLDQAERIIFEVAQKKIKQSFYSIKDIVKDSFRTIEKLYEKKELITGVPTGYHELDKMTAGLQPSDLVILAGRPSMGKTALALNMAAHASVEMNMPSAIFSLEMSKEQLVQRLLCSEAKVSGSKLRGGFLSESDWPKLTRAAGSLSEAPIYIDDTPAINVLEMRAKARRLQKDKGIKLIIVDYLQLMRSVTRSDSREREISEISGSLKALAKELSVPVLAISQLNRAVESRHDKRPQMADLRESGAIEQDADVIMFVYRDEVYNRESQEKGIAEVIIGKQRNGPVGFTKLAFLNEYTKFENLAKRADEAMIPVDAAGMEEAEDVF
ncbi:MAG: replicative DNA helicase [Deltaproteobacteria bacterium]|nr:replicative DNA helicase [Deltaproteobacteria bacterium]MBI2975309.1 replicative DNA helicase [Deltaproteobacteria bacterium]